MSDDGCGGSFTQLLITVSDSQQMEDRIYLNVVFNTQGVEKRDKNGKYV